MNYDDDKWNDESRAFERYIIDNFYEDGINYTQDLRYYADEIEIIRQIFKNEFKIFVGALTVFLFWKNHSDNWCCNWDYLNNDNVTLIKEILDAILKLQYEDEDLNQDDKSIEFTKDDYKSIASVTVRRTFPEKLI